MRLDHGVEHVGLVHRQAEVGPRHQTRGPFPLLIAPLIVEVERPCRRLMVLRVDDRAAQAERLDHGTRREDHPHCLPASAPMPQRQRRRQRSPAAGAARCSSDAGRDGCLVSRSTMSQGQPGPASSRPAGRWASRLRRAGVRRPKRRGAPPRRRPRRVGILRPIRARAVRPDVLQELPEGQAGMSGPDDADLLDEPRDSVRIAVVMPELLHRHPLEGPVYDSCLVALFLASPIGASLPHRSRVAARIADISVVVHQPELIAAVMAHRLMKRARRGELSMLRTRASIAPPGREHRLVRDDSVRGLVGHAAPLACLLILPRTSSHRRASWEAGSSP